MPTATTQENRCEHCGTACGPAPVRLDDKPFCCEGCKMVYSLLSGHGLGGYYTYNQRPGQNRRSPMRADKYAFLDDEQVSQRLYAFRNEKECHIAFHLPQIHCSSCLYLLENLRRLDAGVLSSRVDFAGRQAFIVFDPAVTSLRKVAELLALIGYEPYISMADLGVKAPAVDRRRIYQIGVAGFCFGNIMLMSFPEYLGLGPTEALFRNTFRWLSLVLSVPVVAFAAQPFYSSAWKAIRRRYLNI
ncbi:MAG TPA: heavy metal translocating P-type ATPase metal-binding domain-containing protein, partial [Puia sp.]|nr:heavy metal translocating P-type ATPase metal-binding domain-containing protein [Puia sp.]